MVFQKRSLLICALVLLACGGPTHGKKLAEELTSAKDAIFATKAKDVVALALFGDDDKSSRNTFGQVVQSFSGASKEAIAFYTSSNAEVLERYNSETNGKLPALLVFRGFDETGKPKRGKRVKFVYEGESFEKSDVARFIMSTAIPAWVSIPSISGSPDEVSRLQLADTSSLPKVFVFAEEWPEAKVEALLKMAEPLVGQLVVYKNTYDQYGEDDHAKFGKLMMFENIFASKFDSLKSALKDGDTVVVGADIEAQNSDVITLFENDKITDADVATLVEFAENFADPHRDVIPMGKSSSKKSKKKKSKKGEL